MEKETGVTIAAAFQELIKFLPYGLPPLYVPNIERILELTIIPTESTRMQFEIPRIFAEKKGGENLNLQYPNIPAANFVLQRALTNYRTSYEPTFPIRDFREKQEKDFYKKPWDYTREHAEVICRIARNRQSIWDLMKESYKKGHRFSAMGFLELAFYSKKLDHQIITGIPLLGIPGVIKSAESLANPELEKEPKKLEEIKASSKLVIDTLIDFARKYQKPSVECLEEEGYKY